MNKQALRQQILEQIQLPSCTGQDAALNDFGIRPDAPEPQTERLQQAIDFLSARGGGRLSLPAGVYRTGALRLKSGVELHLASPGTVLQFMAEDPDAACPIVLSHWEATPCWNYSALLYACDACDIAVTGPGTLDGGADFRHWWNWHHQVERSWSDDLPDLQLPARTALRAMNQNGVPVSERVFGAGHFLRPNFIQLIRCERVLLRDFTIVRSPMWQVNPVFCRSVTVDGLTLSSHGPNNDGCDPESCRGVWIKNCRFDTGDDCISLKSGRDRDGRESATPCQDILIEHNDFADGHGGIALGSEMSGGIRRVLAAENHFSSPSLTYALRFKTNARRGGFVEQIMLCDSTMDHVHGAAIHGTMLYEDGRNGDSLPVFRDITIEHITARGGDYGIFLEAFPEVPVTGLTLRHIRIDGVRRPLRSLNWKDALVEDVVINGLVFPRPDHVRILGIPVPGETVRASAEHCGSSGALTFSWLVSADGTDWQTGGTGETFPVPEGAAFLRLHAENAGGQGADSRTCRVLSGYADPVQARLACRGLLGGADRLPETSPVTRGQLAQMMVPLADPDAVGPVPSDTEDPALVLAAASGFFPLDETRRVQPERTVTRQEMATVAMQACGVSYRNASSTMPVCADSAAVANNYGTNVSRALYFGFMTLEEDRFCPERLVTVREAEEILNRVADFAGL